MCTENGVQELTSRLLFGIDITLGARLVLNGAPSGDRRIVAVAGGAFQGPRMKDVILPGGGDWLVQRSDKAVHLDVRLTLRTDDEALIYMT